MCMFPLDREGSELHIVIQDTHSSSSNKTIQLEVNLINVCPSASESLLLHRRREQVRRGETDILRHDRFAFALAGKS